MDARATCHQARARPLNMRSQARASQCATTCLLYLQTDYHFSTVFILFLFPFSTLHWCTLALCYPNNIKLTLFFRPNTRSFAHSLSHAVGFWEGWWGEGLNHISVSGVCAVQAGAIKEPTPCSQHPARAFTSLPWLALLLLSPPLPSLSAW